MARTVNCIKLGREADGMDFPPYPGELGKRIYTHVSKEAWATWLKQQTMLVNENKSGDSECLYTACQTGTTAVRQGSAGGLFI